jgi:two-component system, OmpR family, phosphate regulon sensor histidine kinase PhoR
VWNEFRSNILSSRVYFFELLIFNLFFILLIIIFLNNYSYEIPLIILTIVLSIILLNFIGKKRNYELNEVKLIINNIRKNFYTASEEIKLSSNLSSLQEDIKLMFEKTKADIEDLKRLQKVRTEFLANVSHELRTPIFAIQGYIETLLDGAVNDKKVNKNFLEKAIQHTNNLNTLLNDLIDISMIESGEMGMTFRYFDINEYLQNIVKELFPIASEKNIELIYIPLDKKLQLFGDKGRLRQVMINLIQNSIKYTEKGKVEVMVVEEPKFGKVIVKDTGIGISQEDLGRIFERFYRVDKARSRAVGGTGLGLAIVKHIVEAHGSKVEVSSVVDSGSEFSFRLKK